MTLRTSIACFALALAIAQPLAAQSRGEEVLAVAGGPGAVPASDAYTNLVADGIRAFDQGRYLESRATFSRAHELRPNARTLRGMGLAAYEAGRYALAVYDFERALAETRQAMTPTQRAEIEKLLLKADAQSARYRMRGLPRDAALLVDGEPSISDSRGALLVDAGKHELSLQLASGQVQRWGVMARGGETRDLDLGARVAPASAPAPRETTLSRAETRAPTLDTTETSRSESQPAQIETESHTNATRIWGYAALGGAAIAGGLAIWQWRARESEVANWNSDGCLQGGRTRRTNCEASERAYGRAERWAWVLGGATLALSGAAVVLLLTSSDERAPNQAKTLCVPGPAAVACRVSF